VFWIVPPTGQEPLPKRPLLTLPAPLRGVGMAAADRLPLMDDLDIYTCPRLEGRILPPHPPLRPLARLVPTFRCSRRATSGRSGLKRLKVPDVDRTPTHRTGFAGRGSSLSLPIVRRAIRAYYATPLNVQ